MHLSKFAQNALQDLRHKLTKLSRDHEIKVSVNSIWLLLSVGENPVLMVKEFEVHSLTH